MSPTLNSKTTFLLSFCYTMFINDYLSYDGRRLTKNYILSEYIKRKATHWKRSTLLHRVTTHVPCQDRKTPIWKPQHWTDTPVFNFNPSDTETCTFLRLTSVLSRDCNLFFDNIVLNLKLSNDTKKKCIFSD